MEKLAPTGAGAGRGKQGGPTAEEIKYRNSDEYVSPDIEKSIKEEKEFKKYSAENPEQHSMKNGGSASSRGDGIAQRGKTRGTLVMCGGGMK